MEQLRHHSIVPLEFAAYRCPLQVDYLLRVNLVVVANQTFLIKFSGFYFIKVNF